MAHEHPAQEDGRKLAEELKAERELNARMHRYFGTAATLLVVVALVVALSRMRAMFGVSPLEALGVGATGVPWILLILAAGMVVSLGPLLLGRLLDRLRGKKAGK